MIAESEEAVMAGWKHYAFLLFIAVLLGVFIGTGGVGALMTLF